MNDQNDKSTQTPAPALSGPGATQKPDLLADIRPGGFVDQILDMSRQSVRDKARQLHDQLREDLKMIREAVKFPAHYFRTFGSVAQDMLPSLLVRFVNDQYRANAVLRYCLGARWSIEDDNDAVQASAIKEYQKLPDEFDAVLRDFIPSDFRVRARAVIDGNNFDTGNAD